MRQTILAVVATFLISFLFMPVVAHAQTPVMPDYTNWEKYYSEKKPFVLQGKDVQLLLEGYHNLDDSNLDISHPGWNGVVLLYNEAGGSWLAIYMVVTQEDKPNKAGYVEKMIYYLFENSASRWVFVKDFYSDRYNYPDFLDFMKQKYGLVIS